MSDTTLEPRYWTRRRWWTLIALVFTAHLGLIFALGDRKPVTVRPPAAAPAFLLADARFFGLVSASNRVRFEEFLMLNDPTLFALPHREDFAGATWAHMPDVEFQPFRWTEPARLLALPAEKLGVIFTRFMQTNVPAPFELQVKPAPESTLPVAPEVGPAIAARSTLRIVGELASRRLLNPPELKSWAAVDLLTNSVVQVLVNEDGNVFSSTLLARSGLEKADHFALETARAARFEPLRGGTAKLNFGTLIFQWHTVPKTEINAPPSGP